MESKNLYQLIHEGLEGWRKTGVLPNGEKWFPYDQVQTSPHVRRFQVSSFTSLFCSKFNMNRQIAISVLRYLEDSDIIKIVWQSPRGSYFNLLKCDQFKKKKS